MSLNAVGWVSVFGDGEARLIWAIPPSVERLMTAVSCVQFEPDGDLVELIYESGEYEAAHCEAGDPLNLLQIVSAVQAKRVSEMVDKEETETE